MSHSIQYLRAFIDWVATLPIPRERTFGVGANSYRYFTSRYNVTWLNERSVEIPLMRKVLETHQGAKLLEVGHVLGHYDKSGTHDVVDKYEVSDYPALYREDALGFQGNAPYDLIISISTLEHVGWDEDPQDVNKIGFAIQHLRSLLRPNGRLFFTVPVGYSPGLDAFLDRDEEFINRACLQRVSIQNEWREVEWSSIRKARFHAPYPFANGLVFGELGYRSP